MKIADYNQMMAYLTRPEPLPQPKPEELLEIQEQKRKDRLRKTMEEIGPVLMDESVDFIERNEMAIGGGAIEGEDLGTREGFAEARVAKVVDQHILQRKSPTTPPLYRVEVTYVDPKLLKKFGYDSPRSTFQKKFTGPTFKTLKEAQNYRDKVAYPKLAKQLDVDVDYIKNSSKTKSFARLVKEFLPKNKKGYITGAELAAELGEPEKFVTKAGPGRDSSFVKAVKKLLDQTDATQFGFKGTPGQPFYVYKKPTPKQIELLKKYKTNQGSQLATGTGYNMVTPKVAERIKFLDKSPFFKNLINSKKVITLDMLDNPDSDLNKFLKKNNMNFNEFLRASLRYSEAANGDFLINVTDPILTDKPIAKNKKISDKIYETFQNSLTGRVGDPIRAAVYRAAMSDISEQLGQETTTFSNYKTYLRNRANKILGTGSKIDIDEIVGVSSSARNKTAPYSVFSRFVDEALNQGKLSSFQNALSGRTAKLKAAIAKNDMKAADKIVKAFDAEIYKPYMAELKAMGADNVDLPRLTLLGPTSKTLGGGKGRIAELKAQGLDFDEFFKKEKFGYVMPKGALTQKELLSLSQGKFKTLLNDVKKIGCPVGKADGGRVEFSEGLNCFNKGVKAINTGNIPEGAGKRNFIKFANKAMEIGKQSGRGLRTITKFGIIPEAIIIGADTLIRAGMGDTFNEAFLRASDIYRTDEAYEQADASEISRRMNSNDGELILNLRKFNTEKQKLSSLEQQKEADLALAGDDFAETNIGMTEEEIEKFYAPKIQEQENNLFNASISDAEERAGFAKEMEFADKKGVDYKKSPVGKILDVAAERPGIKQFVDLFATEARGEPDVSAQVLENYLSGKIPQEEEKELQKIIDTGGARGVLDAMKKIEAAQEVPEGAIREPNVFDEERKTLFELAKTDSALAERLFGPSMTFAGDPIQQTDLQDEMNLDRGIYALGGRIGFADGPNNPDRRMFMKLMAGIASLPILGKFFKPAVPVVKKLANTTTVMPDWFPDFVDRFIGRSIGKKIDADLMEYKNTELPGVTLTKGDDGQIVVEGKNAYGEPYEIVYRPPGYELVDETTGKAVKTPGEFIASDTQYRRTGPEMDDFDVDGVVVDDIDDILGGNATELEGYAKGTGEKKYTPGQKQIDVADAEGTRADVDEGPDIDMSDYED